MEKCHFKTLIANRIVNKKRRKRKIAEQWKQPKQRQKILKLEHPVHPFLTLNKKLKSHCGFFTTYKQQSEAQATIIWFR